MQPNCRNWMTSVELDGLSVLLPCFYRGARIGIGSAAVVFRGRPQMKPYWINPGANGRLAIVPRPRGGDWLADDLHALRREGIDILVSLLTPSEVEELGLTN